MIAAWLGDLAEPMCGLLGATVFVALVLAHLVDRPRWAPTLPPPRRQLTPGEVADRFVRDLIDRREAYHAEPGLHVRCWHYSWGHVLQWRIELDGHVTTAGSTDAVWTIVRDAVLLARGGEA